MLELETEKVIGIIFQADFGRRACILHEQLILLQILATKRGTIDYNKSPPNISVACKPTSEQAFSKNEERYFMTNKPQSDEFGCSGTCRDNQMIIVQCSDEIEFGSEAKGVEFKAYNWRKIWKMILIKRPRFAVQVRIMFPCICQETTRNIPWSK
jgi:hypothetical protein